MKKITFLALATLVAAFSYAAKVNTGIYLVFAPYGDPPTTYDITNLDPDLEFNEDLGEGYYGLSVPLSKLGVDGFPTESVNKLCRVYQPSQTKWSQCDSYWLEGLRVHYVPSYRHDDHLKFVVKASTLEFNYNATYGLNGVFAEWGVAKLDPWYNQNHSEANEYVTIMNEEENIYTTRFSANSGAQLGNGNTLGTGLGAMHFNHDLSHYFGPYKSAETGREAGDKHIFNDGFGIPKNTNDLVIRAAFNLNRLRFSIFHESNEYTLAGTTEKFFLQGDKYVLFKNYAAGTHQINVATTSFDLPAGDLTSFTVANAGLVKIWFYADTNPNVVGNLRVEQNVQSLEQKYARPAFLPEFNGTYLFQSVTGNAFLKVGADGTVVTTPIAVDNNGLAAENADYRLRFFSRHFYPGRGIDMHGPYATGLFKADRWDPAAGLETILAHTSESSNLGETALNYWLASYENFEQKVFEVRREKVVKNVSYYSIKTMEGAALTMNPTATEFAPYTGADNQLWIITSSEKFTGVVVTDNVQSSTSNAVVYTQAGNVHIDNLMAGDQVEVYAMTGVLVKKFTASSSNESFGLTKGAYVVKINSNVDKVVVR